MQKGTMAALVFLSFTVVSSLALAQDRALPPGWGQPAPLPPANGEGQVIFKHGGTTLTLPLNKIEINTSTPDARRVSLSTISAQPFSGRACRGAEN